MPDPEKILQRLAQLSPGKLLLYAWLAMLALGLVSIVKALSGVAAALGYLLVLGYPYLVAGGLPAGIVRTRVRRIARVLFMVLLVVAAISAVIIPTLPDPHAGEAQLQKWSHVIVPFVGVVFVVIFAPFFLGTAALNDVVKARRGGLQFEWLQHFVGLYFLWFGGIFWVHPKVQLALMTNARKSP